MTGDQVDAYDKVIEAVKDRVAPRAVSLLERIRDVVRDADFTADDEPSFMDGDDYRWSLRVWRPGEAGEESCIDVSIEIAEAMSYGDDEAHEGFGVNFGLDLVEWGGRILGGLTPYNYSDKVWVDARNEDAVSERWRILEDADVTGIPELIKE